MKYTVGEMCNSSIISSSFMGTAHCPYELHRSWHEYYVNLEELGMSGKHPDAITSYPRDGGCTYLQNIRSYIPNCMVLHPRWL
jgi:hypothetical protein